MSCAAWPGDLLVITGAGMGGGRRASVCAPGTIDHTHLSGTVYHQTTATLFLSRILLPVVEGFSYVYPGYRALFHASTSLPQRGIL